jgi:hypothetical protein
MKVFPGEATTKKLEMQCEEQELSGGPYLPPADSCNGLTDPERFPDYCAQLRR